MKSIIGPAMVNIDHLEPGEIPNITAPDSLPLLMWAFDGLTIWLRRDQLAEIITRLVPHIPELPVPFSKPVDDLPRALYENTYGKESL